MGEGPFPVGLGQRRDLLANVAGKVRARVAVKVDPRTHNSVIRDLSLFSSPCCLSWLSSQVSWVTPHSLILVEIAPQTWQTPWTWLSLLQTREVSSLKESLWLEDGIHWLLRPGTHTHVDWDLVPGGGIGVGGSDFARSGDKWILSRKNHQVSSSGLSCSLDVSIFLCFPAHRYPISLLLVLGEEGTSWALQGLD